MALRTLIALLVTLHFVNAAPVKWSRIYTAWPQNPEFFSNARSVVNCTGPYALCSYAACKIISIGSKEEPSIAECGCYGQPKPTGDAAVNIGSAAGMLDRQAKTENYKACFNGTLAENNQVCATANVAPACASQSHRPRPSMYKGRFDLISTFNSATWPYDQLSPGTLCTYGQYTNCYSAGCSRKRAWNGANTTCYCPVYNVKPSENVLFVVASGNATCLGSKGFTVGSIVWNGAGVARL